MANENTIQATGTFITRKGLNLITKLVAAKGTLSFSRAAVGTGKPPEGYSPDSMISLSSYKMDAEIADYGTREDKAYVTMQVSSDQVEEGFLLTEVGLYATDPDEGEILYAYMDISTDPTYIYANGSANRTKYAEFTLYVLIGTVEKVTAAVTPGSIITKETFKASNMPVTDTHGIMGDSGSTVMSQELFDAVAEKIVNELVSNARLNTVLTEKLADYIMKSKIVNHLLATDESTVLSGPMGKELKGLIDVLNTKLSEKSIVATYDIPDRDGVSTKPDYISTGFHNITQYSNGQYIYSIQAFVYPTSLTDSVIGNIPAQYMHIKQDVYSYCYDMTGNRFLLIRITPAGEIRLETLNGTAIPQAEVRMRGSIVF